MCSFGIEYPGFKVWMLKWCCLKMDLKHMLTFFWTIYYFATPENI